MHLEKYGDIFEIYLANKRQIVINRPGFLDNLYSPSTKARYFSRPTINGLEDLGVRKGITFNQNYEAWRRNRKILAHAVSAPSFLKKALTDSQEIFKRAESKWKDGQILDLAVWVKCFTTDFIMQTSTSEDSYYLAWYQTPEEERDENMKFSRKLYCAIETWLSSIAFFVTVPKFLRHYAPGVRSLQLKFVNNTQWIRDFFRGIIKKRRELRKSSSNEKDGDFLDIMLAAYECTDEMGDEPLDDDEICDAIMDITIGGIDTTSDGFCFVLWYLHNYPDVKQRFLDEINSILGADTNRAMTIEDIDKFVYLDAIIKEVFRVFTLAPLTLRRITTEDTLGGFNWPAGTDFWINHQAANNHPDYWVDPKVFNPDRFLNGEHLKAKNMWTTFGGGRYLATLEIKALLINFHRKYEVGLVDKDAPIRYWYAITNHCSKLEIELHRKKPISKEE
ncbi:16029_t:CDS:2 [Acaulospora colombiana]|uniref:16029_t:CDS:1 n=1 Tax=Acaulospora colombiana TaxID=27376 RepID=A0ACA9L4L0_9GLOM|nr:16029_t:CDS:2 [Acaulospora colombiana]